MQNIKKYHHKLFKLTTNIVLFVLKRSLCTLQAYKFIKLKLKLKTF